MPLTIVDTGTNNTIEASEETRQRMVGTIRFTGDGNRVVFGDGCTSLGLDLDLRGGALLEVGAECRLGTLKVHAVAGSSVRVGARTTFNGRSRLLLHEPAAIVVGARCLFGGNCTLTVSDMHSVVDVASGQRINPARDIRVAEHVWLGENVMVLKGTTIAADSVVGAGSTATGEIPAGVIAVGSPARVVREGVTWDTRLL